MNKKDQNTALDAVWTNKKYGRPPRKVGVVTCDTGIKDGYQRVTKKYILRLRDDGTFIAEHGDDWYESKSREALQAKMNEIAKVTLDIQWSRYLLVTYETAILGSRSWRSTRTLNVHERRPHDAVIVGFHLTWDVIECTSAFDVPGFGTRYMRRDVIGDDESQIVTDTQTITKLPAGLVLYTRDREAALRRMRDSIGTFDKKMVSLFGGTPDEIGGNLDTYHVDDDPVREAAARTSAADHPTKPRPKPRTKRG